MKRSRFVRWTLLLAMVCLVFWQAPTLMDRVLSLRDQFLGAPAQEAVASPPRRLTPRRAAGRKELLVISPNGAGLTPEEQARLKQMAEREAPIRPGPAARTPEDPALQDPESFDPETQKEIIEKTLEQILKGEETPAEDEGADDNDNDDAPPHDG